MTDPYRHQEPTPPRKPKVFSPFRPVRRAIWYVLVPLQDASNVFFAELMTVAFGTVIPVMISAAANEPLILFIAVLIASPVVTRRWLISAMHLDNEESRDWWQSKFLY